MTFPSLRLPAILPAGSTPLWVAGNCDERAGGPLRALVALFFHAAARAFDRNARRVSKSNPRHPKASVVMSSDHHTRIWKCPKHLRSVTA